MFVFLLDHMVIFPHFFELNFQMFAVWPYCCAQIELPALGLLACMRSSCFGEYHVESSSVQIDWIQYKKNKDWTCIDVFLLISNHLNDHHVADQAALGSKALRAGRVDPQTFESILSCCRFQLKRGLFSQTDTRLQLKGVVFPSVFGHLFITFT